MGWIRRLYFSLAELTRFTDKWNRDIWSEWIHVQQRCVSRLGFSPLHYHAEQKRYIQDGWMDQRVPHHGRVYPPESIFKTSCLKLPLHFSLFKPHTRDGSESTWPSVWMRTTGDMFRALISPRDNTPEWTMATRDECVKSLKPLCVQMEREGFWVTVIENLTRCMSLKSPIKL